MAAALPTLRPPAFAPRPALEPLRVTSRAVNAICFGLRAASAIAWGLSNLEHHAQVDRERAADGLPSRADDVATIGGAS